ncbi:hypothetical protein BVY04_03350 [bacterium M21]|nr:hypothetical protein BVY04_03350 [bacterium M21]
MRILIIDDEPIICENLCDFLQKSGHEVESRTDCSTVFQTIDSFRPDIVLLDIRLKDADGLTLLPQLCEHWPDMAVIMISGHGSMDHAIEAMRLGASDFLKKPISLADLEVALDRCHQLLQFRRTPTNAPPKVQHNDLAMPFIGSSPLAQLLYKEVQLAARSACDTVLITGETGSGKEVVAKLFHSIRCKDSQPFVAVNCPAIPETLVESELFGHKQGAFTGALENRKGAFEMANNGVLFLDEISELDTTAQAKLLRILETRTVRPVGSVEESPLDLCVLAASNRNLQECIANGTFRQDLFYRLNSFQINVPPLRQRKLDIPELVVHMIKQYTLKTSLPIPEIDQKAMHLLTSYDYPGNIRELKNIVERACILAADSTQIEVDHIRLPSPLSFPKDEVNYDLTATSQNEAQETALALRSTGWNRSKAARKLGISYDTIRWRISKYDLNESV